MKKVFSSNSELSKIFANQTQTLGRSNSMFFEHQIIYSYGYHYEIAKIVYNDKGKDIVFVNSNHYSSSTAKHKNHVLRAIRENKYSFLVPFINGYNRQYFDVTKLPEIINLISDNIATLLKKQLRANKSVYHFEQAKNLFNTISEISILFNLSSPIKPNNWQDAETKVKSLLIA
jgi:hypothetical protein